MAQANLRSVPGVICLAAALAACGGRPGAGPTEAEGPRYTLYRFDDHLESAAAISAPEMQSFERLADPIVWKDFLTEKDATWDPARGLLGLRDGDLIVKGDGSGSPVIVSPKEPVIDWSLYDTVAIRMMAEGGEQVRIKIGRLELARPLGPPKQYRVYRFDVNVEAPRGSRPLAIMPTDSPVHLAAIDSIELIPRRTSFPKAAGVQTIGKEDEYRRAIYAHSPSTITYETLVPPGGRLRFGLGVARKQPITFRVLAGPAATPVFSRTLDDPGRWEDAEVDLSAFANTTTRVVFETQADAAGAVGFWSNPLLTAGEGKRPPNVLIYLVCSLRPDHMSLYGYSRDTTPFLRSFAASAAVFDDAQAQAPWTKASVPSLLTSLYPYTLGLRRDMDIISRRATTLAETLRSAGYLTASMVTNPFAGKASGLERGLDWMLEYPAVHRHRTEEADRGTDSAALNKAAFPWLNRNAGVPFFLYLHSTDPHAPYRPPKGFEEKFADPAETKQYERDNRALWDRHQYGGGTAVTPAECRAKGIDPDTFIRRAADRYDGEVAFMDRSFEQLVGELRKLNILDDTLIVFVTDHGEEFFEHGATAHGHSLYRELLHAALLLWNPKLIPSPRRIPDTVQLLDVYPTILDLLGIEPGGLVQGQSLKPLLEGRTIERKAPVMASRFAHPSARPEGLIAENRTGTFAIWDARWKLLYRDRAAAAGLPEVELYDHRNDRLERRNAAAGNPEAVKRLRAELERWIAAQNELAKALGPAGKSELDPQAIERLRTLGYIGGKAPE